MATYFFWTALFPLVGVLAFQMDGVSVGATEGPAMRNAMIVSSAGYFAISLCSLEAFGNHGTWGSMWVFLILRGVTLTALYPALECLVSERKV